MRLKNYKMAKSVLLKFLNLKFDISRTIWCIEVSDGSCFFFFYFHFLALSLEFNLFFERSFPLKTDFIQFENMLQEFLDTNFPYRLQMFLKFPCKLLIMITITSKPSRQYRSTLTLHCKYPAKSLWGQCKLVSDKVKKTTGSKNSLNETKKIH